MSTALPPKAPPPRAPTKQPTPSSPAPSKAFGVNTGIQQSPLKVVLYGAGGIGKTELAANLTTCGVKPLFIDLENGTHYLDVSRVDEVTDWDSLRSVLHNGDMLNAFDAVVIDSLTKAEELAGDWTPGRWAS